MTAVDSEINLLLTGDVSDTRGSVYYKTVILPLATAPPAAKLDINSNLLLQSLALNKYYKTSSANPSGIHPVFADFVAKVEAQKAKAVATKLNPASFPSLVDITGINPTPAGTPLLITGALQAIFNTGNAGWSATFDNWFPTIPAGTPKQPALNFDIDIAKFINDIKSFHYESDSSKFDYFPLTDALNKAISPMANSSNTLQSNEVNMIAQCVMNGDANECYKHLGNIVTANGSAPQLQAAVDSISPKILIGALDRLGFKIKTLNGMTAIQDYNSWVRRAEKNGLDPILVGKLRNRTDLLSQLVNMMVNRARTEALMEPEQEVVYERPKATEELQFGLTGFYPVTHYQMAQTRLSPVEELQKARKMIRDLQAAAGLHKLRNMNGYVMQFGGEPDYQSGGDGTNVYKNLFESLYKQVKAVTGRDIDDQPRKIIDDAIKNLDKYDAELRRFLKDLGIVSTVANIFANTPQGPVTQSMLHAAVTKYKACLAKYAIRQGNILGVADQLCGGAV